MRFIASSALLFLLFGCGGSSERPTVITEPEIVIDKQPDTFIFPEISNAPRESYAESAEVSIQGINADIDLVIQGGEYSINSAPFTSSSTVIKNGDSLKLRHLSSSDYESETITEVTVGNYTAQFKSITLKQPDDTSAPQASISYPLESVAKFGDSITVKGTVSDISEVTSLSVNGNSIMLSDSSLLKNFEQVSGKSSDVKQYSWETVVTPDKYGNYHINVATSDTFGNTNVSAASSNVYIPVELDSVIFDSINNVIYGTKLRKLYRVKPTERSIELLSTEHPAFDASALFIDSDNQQLFTVNTAGRVITIHKTIINQDASISIEKVFENTEIYSEDIVYTGSDYSAEKNRIALNFISNDSQTNDKLIEVDLTSKDTTTIVQRVSELRPHNIAYISDYLVLVSSDLIEVFNPDSGALTFSYKPENYITAITKGGHENQLYMVGFNSISSIDITTGLLTIHKAIDANSLQVFAQPRKVMLDNTNNQLLIQDSQFNSIQAFSLSSSEITKYYSAGRGAGPRLVSSRVMDITNDGQWMYLFDDGGNATPAIFKVNIASGERTLVTKLVKSSIQTADELVLDEANNRLFMLTNNIIFTIDLSDAKIEVFDSTNTAVGVYMESMHDLAFDTSTNALYVTDSLNSNIVRIDIATKKRTLISSVESSGVIIPVISDIAIRSKTNSLLVLDAQESVLYEVSIENGSRTKILDYCTDHFEEDILNDDTWARDLVYHAEQDAVYIQADNLLKYEFASQQCFSAGRDKRTMSYGDLIFNAQGRLFSTDLNNVKQIEFDTANEVTISAY